MGPLAGVSTPPTLSSLCQTLVKAPGQLPLRALPGVSHEQGLGWPLWEAQSWAEAGLLWRRAVRVNVGGGEAEPEHVYGASG